DYHTYAFGYLEALTEQVKNNPDVIRNVRISQSLLREAHIQEPNNFLVLNKLALNLINSGVFLAEDHVVEIKELIRQLQQVAPNRAETHRIVAVNAFVLKDYVTARVSMETSLKLEPNNPRNLWLAAQINKAASFEPEAFAYAMKAFRLGYTPRSLSSMTWVIQDSSKYGTKEENDLVAKVANQIAN
ncbi:MAG TPA: hypothetical protein VEA59_05000, partial [Patescibacteria group bacterium]|nr:hypothetical protein [Patescibacteria group bacterium]